MKKKDKQRELTEHLEELFERFAASISNILKHKQFNSQGNTGNNNDNN